MKVYSISRWAFFGICILILILPVSRHWQLLTTGGRTTGTVNQYTMRIVEDIMGERDLRQASEILYQVDETVHKAYGPTNYEYEVGRSIFIFYNKRDPTRYCVATFTGFYLNNYVIISIILLTVWYAFYLSFNNYRRRKKREKMSRFSPRSIAGKN